MPGQGTLETCFPGFLSALVNTIRISVEVKIGLNFNLTDRITTSHKMAELNIELHQVIAAHQEIIKGKCKS